MKSVHIDFCVRLVNEAESSNLLEIGAICRRRWSEAKAAEQQIQREAITVGVALLGIVAGICVNHVVGGLPRFVLPLLTAVFLIFAALNTRGGYQAVRALKVARAELRFAQDRQRAARNRYDAVMLDVRRSAPMAQTYRIQDQPGGGRSLLFDTGKSFALGSSHLSWTLSADQPSSGHQ